MQHPLENPSLTPFGFVFPYSKRRLKYTPRPGTADGDRLAAKYWARVNRLSASEPRPAETIIHDVMPAIAARGRTTEGDFIFAGRPYQSRDILVLSTFAQWFGTNVGNSFLTSKNLRFKEVHPERYFIELFAYERKSSWYGAHLIHVCTEECKNKYDGPKWICKRSPAEVTDRDELVITALMHWLGKPAGQAYITGFQTYCKTALASIHQEYIRNRQAKGVAA